MTTPPGAAAGSEPGSSTGGVGAPASTFPGLSEACTAAIRAQAAVNELFAKALKESTTAPVPAQPATTAGTASGTAPVTKPTTGPVTKDDVAHTFDEVAAIVPPALATPFQALHEAANKITETAKQNIPDVLAATPVTGALKTITDYITNCQPPTSN